MELCAATIHLSLSFPRGQNGLIHEPRLFGSLDPAVDPTFPFSTYRYVQYSGMN